MRVQQYCYLYYIHTVLLVPVRQQHLYKPCNIQHTAATILGTQQYFFTTDELRVRATSIQHGEHVTWSSAKKHTRMMRCVRVYYGLDRQNPGCPSGNHSSRQKARSVLLCAAVLLLCYRYSSSGLAVYTRRFSLTNMTHTHWVRHPGHHKQPQRSLPWMQLLCTGGCFRHHALVSNNEGNKFGTTDNVWTWLCWHSRGTRQAATPLVPRRQHDEKTEPTCCC